jgi:hypothetical protein
VEFGREGDLEQDVLHNVGAIWTLELEGLALIGASVTEERHTVQGKIIHTTYLEEDIVEAPGLGSQDGGETLFALLDEEGEVDSSGARVTCSPRLAGSSVRSMAVGAERLSVHPCLGDRINRLVPRKAEEFGNNGGGGDLDEDDVIETDTVEGVEESKASLDFVGLDHGLENVMDGQGLSLAGEVISNREDGTQVVGRMSPYASE